MNPFSFKNKSFLTFISESKSSVRSVSIRISDDEFYELLDESIFAILHNHFETKMKEEEYTLDNQFLANTNARSLQKKYKENEDYSLIISTHVESDTWPHYPVILGIKLNDKELEEKIISYIKKHDSWALSEKEDKKEHMLVAILNAAIYEYEGIGYKFVEKVEACNQSFNSIIMTICVE